VARTATNKCNGQVDQLIIYRAFIEDELDAPKHLARRVHELYFAPEHEDFQARTMWSLSNAFTSAFKELDPIPQFKATARLGPWTLSGARAGVLIGCVILTSRLRPGCSTRTRAGCLQFAGKGPTDPAGQAASGIIPRDGDYRHFGFLQSADHTTSGTGSGSSASRASA
jgi:hypothetical protein